ncbi:Reticulata-related 4 protein, partial [Thalictrum thalictroides]
MAISAAFNPSTRSLTSAKFNHNRSSSNSTQSIIRLTTTSLTSTSTTNSNFSLLKFQSNHNKSRVIVRLSGGSGGNGSNNNGGGNNGNGGGGEGDDEDDKNNNAELVLLLAEFGKTLKNVPEDLAKAVKSGKIPVSILRRFFELEKSPFFKWLLQFGGFRERLLADDLFLAKLSMECGVGIFTKTAAEYDRRKDNFMKELDFVIADV